MTEPRICSVCDKPKPLSDYYRNRASRDGYKVRCKLCQQAARRRLKNEGPEERKARRARIYRPRYGEVDSPYAATLLSCPIDSELGLRLYPPPARFPRQHFQDTLAAGYWPDGSVWEVAAEFGGEKATWRVSGCYLHEVDGSRVARAEFGAGDQATMTLV